MKRPDRRKKNILESKTKSKSGIDPKRNYKNNFLHCLIQKPITKYEEEYMRPGIIRNNESQCRTSPNKHNQATSASRTFECNITTWRKTFLKDWIPCFPWRTNVAYKYMLCKSPTLGAAASWHLLLNLPFTALRQKLSAHICYHTKNHRSRSCRQRQRTRCSSVRSQM